VQKEQMKPNRRKIQIVVDVVAYLKASTNKYHYVHPNVKLHVNNFSHEIKVGDINMTRLLECSTMKGNCSKHQAHILSSKDPTFCQYW
jgi:hypothetical protein